MSAGLVAVGEVLLDVVAPQAEGRVAHVPVSVRAGGVPVNVAVAAARAGVQAAVVGRVGRDAAAAAIEHALAAAGVTALLQRDETLPTGTFVRLGGRIAADRGASAALRAGDVPALEARAVVVSGYALLHEDTRPAARAALERARAEHVAVVAPAAGLMATVEPDEFHRLAAGATALFLNAAEARHLTAAGPRAACAELGRRYAVACVTAGADGAFASIDGALRHLPAPPALLDTTGAGDALAGTLLAQLVGA
ncbi:MAG TPA: PfkB family carbohydrate kinase [Gaiellaceae bacterium]|nr:PfkB family carbohydrate kinase [Gaiellaceae bacterium]